ncbi:flagellar protein FlgN [Paenibacillus sp. JSM ZJ436]|uniref:flagellar protein FlgN n=1 Tax=Paenibacillus sp. JSM ZJ436 TaxID=3376190 RepID=UPI00379D456E
MPIQPLIDTLHKLHAVYLDMLELADSKKLAIMNNNVDQLVQFMNRESKAVKVIEQLEVQRVNEAYTFLRERGIKSRLELSITEISKLVFDAQEKSELSSIQASLSHTLQQLRLKNELNQQLIQQSLAFIDLSLDMLTGKPSQEATYHHPSERSGNTQRSGLFDTRA